MASDSDDEDELLQMALKEQSQRDLNYHRPPSSSSSGQRKPVANFVQPPKKTAGTPPRPGHNQQQQQKKKDTRVVEEDDDSEVEMLSISSGDEEVTKYRGGAKGRGGGGGRGAKGVDDRPWDGEEPDCWKRVNESEVGIINLYFFSLNANDVNICITLLEFQGIQ